jgi:hypothetical protein
MGCGLRTSTSGFSLQYQHRLFHTGKPDDLKIGQCYPISAGQTYMKIGVNNGGISLKKKDGADEIT